MKLISIADSTICEEYLPRIVDRVTALHLSNGTDTSDQIEDVLNYYMPLQIDLLHNQQENIERELWKIPSTISLKLFVRDATFNGRSFLKQMPNLRDLTVKSIGTYAGALNSLLKNRLNDSEPYDTVQTDFSNINAPFRFSNVCHMCIDLPFHNHIWSITPTLDHLHSLRVSFHECNLEVKGQFQATFPWNYIEDTDEKYLSNECSNIKWQQ
ncbi:unnamed protein product [Adineta ricciae]|uniref:Uncharacterized protein n=1 Tax=Adineta ricciae TaxID=249248 RepID=A0A815F6J8_ADIRI|nr:unnamed protein product [Adineta ricciae]CAF1595689.1 unnamed protein product [Adineta ricciae]